MSTSHRSLELAREPFHAGSRRVERRFHLVPLRGREHPDRTPAHPTAPAPGDGLDRDEVLDEPGARTVCVVPFLRHRPARPEEEVRFLDDVLARRRRRVPPGGVDAVEPADPDREVPNPKWKALSAKIRTARAEVKRLSARYGLQALGDAEERRRTLRAFQAEHAQEAGALWRAFERLDALERRRKKVPQRVPVKEVIPTEVVKLSIERKHLTNLVKMIAYQVESDLFHGLARHYKRNDDEGRTLVQTALASAADIDVTGEELRITLVPLSSPHRSRAVADLCSDLNGSPARFPGTRLWLHFAVADPENRTDS